MRRPRGVVAATFGALALALSGCELTSVEIAEPSDVVVVEAYLRPDEEIQKVFLYRTYDPDDESLRVDSAVIRIRDAGGDEVLLALTPETSPVCASYTVFASGEGGSCYTATPPAGFVRPGSTYTLEVELPDGREITGATTVPGDFDFHEPVPPECVLIGDPLRLVWSPSEGVWAFRTLANLSNLAAGLRQRGVTDPPDDLSLPGLVLSRADTAITFPTEFAVFERLAMDRDLRLALEAGLPAGATAEVLVAAVDRNYVNWATGGDFNPSGQVRVPSVQGDGTGVFGSMVVRRRMIRGETERDDVPFCQ